MDSDDIIDVQHDGPDGEGDNLPVPVRTSSLTNRISPDGYLIALPPGRRLSQNERSELDRELGIQPLAIEEAYAPRQKTYYEILVNIACMALCTGVLWWFFPWQHFFISAPRADKADLHLELITPEEAENKGKQMTDEERTRLELTRLKDNGRLNEMITLCSARLATVPRSECLQWGRVWDIYLWALEKTQKYELLREKSQQLLEMDQDSLSGRYYKALTLIDFSEKRTYSEREKNTYTRDSERAIEYLQQAVERIDSQVDGAERSEARIESIHERRRRYRLKLADAHIKRWFAGGLEYGDTQEVNDHRETAIALLDELGDWVPALERKIDVLRVMKKQRTWNPFFKHWYRQNWVTEELLNSEINRAEALLDKARKVEADARN